MALPSVLSDKGLAKFRTKVCERILATGACSFGDKCQYSHAPRPRRNPKKFAYSPMACSNPETCSHGSECGLAHTTDEERYHPLTYKTVLCPRDRTCGGYYCPFAHSAEELRPCPPCAGGGGAAGPPPPAAAPTAKGKASRQAPAAAARADRQPQPAPRPGRQGRGAASAAPAAVAPAKAPAQRAAAGTAPPPPGGKERAPAQRGNGGPMVAQAPPAPPDVGGTPLEEEPQDSFWYAGDQQDLKVSLKTVIQCIPFNGEALLGGVLRRGLLSPKTDSSSGQTLGEEVQCTVKLLPISRSDSHYAAQVVKEVKRWLLHCGGPERSVLRRTVATTVLALPAQPSTLSRSVGQLRCSIAQQVASQWPLASVAASWVQQLVRGLQALHKEGLSHLCLCPETISVDAAGNLHVGDFLGKVRALRLFESGWHGKPDEAWALWYPPEVHRHLASAAQGGPAAAATLDHVRVDAWQLGLVVFFLLTGEHPFGDRRDPAAVCANIATDRRTSRSLLDQLPLFMDVFSRLTVQSPERRMLPNQASRHPLLWSFDEAVKFTAPLWAGSQVPAWLRHLPALAVFGSATAPPPPEATKGTPAKHSDVSDLVGQLCDKAIAAAAGDFKPPKTESRTPPIKSSYPKHVPPPVRGAAAAKSPPPSPVHSPKRPTPPSPSFTALTALAAQGSQVLLTLPPAKAMSESMAAAGGVDASRGSQASWNLPLQAPGVPCSQILRAPPGLEAPTKDVDLKGPSHVRLDHPIKAQAAASGCCLQQCPPQLWPTAELQQSHTQAPAQNLTVAGFAPASGFESQPGRAFSTLHGSDPAFITTPHVRSRTDAPTGPSASVPGAALDAMGPCSPAGASRYSEGLSPYLHVADYLGMAEVLPGQLTTPPPKPVRPSDAALTPPAAAPVGCPFLHPQGPPPPGPPAPSRLPDKAGQAQHPLPQGSCPLVPGHAGGAAAEQLGGLASPPALEAKEDAVFLGSTEQKLGVIEAKLNRLLELLDEQEEPGAGREAGRQAVAAALKFDSID